ncbi:IS3 family transposase [Palleronia sp. LCG004]|uniref:IS3 family transposase n=1 Tax=Palleronia sp. LCG004 TaxID=3079304 RepID=UPI00397C17E4
MALGSFQAPLASQSGRYGYRWIAAMLRDTGWALSVKRIERTWRQDVGGSGKAAVGRFPDEAEVPAKRYLG